MVRASLGSIDNALNNLNQMPHFNLSNEHLFNSIYARLFEELSINCTYFSENTLCDELSSNTNTISCFSLNVQSLASKFSELRNFLANLSLKNVNLDFICLTETWCADFLRFNLPGYSVFFSARSTDTHGGSAIYIKSNIIATQIKNDSLFFDNLLEATAVKIDLNGFKAVIVSIYRPNTHAVLSNNEQINLFLTKFQALLEFLDSFKLPVIIQGDLNINLFLINDLDSNASTLLDLVTPFGYVQTINRATRISGTSATLLDHCYIKGLIPNHNCSGVVTLDISDHYGVFCTIRTDKIKKRRLPPTKRRLINNQTKMSFFNSLSALSWTEVTSIDDPSLAYDKFLEIWTLHYNLNFPWVSNHTNKKHIPQQPFMSQGLLKCRNNREIWSRIAKSTPLPHLINYYKKYRNIYTKTVRMAQKLYIRNQIAEAGSDSKKIWDTLKDSLRLPKKSNNITKIKCVCD